MQEYKIDVTKIEELQMMKDSHELENIFSRAKSTIVNGEKVILLRSSAKAPAEKFDEFTTLEELEKYRQRIFRYL